MTTARTSWLGAAIVIAACGSAPSPQDLIVDASGDGPIDGMPDAAEPADLASMCGSVPVTLADWEQCYAKRWCEVLVHCSEMNLYRDAAECIAKENAVEGGKLASDAFERARAVTAGTASLDTAEFTQCLVDLSTTKCATAGHPPACAKRFTGTIADHQLCYTDVDCASPGAQCQQPANCTQSCCAGTCTPKPKVGQACDDFVDGCEPGVVCGTDLTCVIGDIGSTCAKRYDCVPGAWCDNGTCKVDLGDGGSCDSLLQCGGETTCVGLMRPVAPATCHRVTQVGDTCDYYCLGNLYCDLPATGFGTCQPIPTHGQACSPSLPCLGVDQRCSAQGQCVDRTAVGQACTDGTCQPELFCTDQLGAGSPVCATRLMDGAPGCNQPAQCQSYVCSGDAAAAGTCQAVQNTCP
jgi:hypothetical protein